MMFAWQMAGLGCLLLALKNRRLVLWSFAGLCYAIGFLFKPFGLFPVLGIALFMAHWLWRERKQPIPVIVTGLSFAVPFLITGLGVAGWLYGKMGFYYSEPLRQHLELGREATAFVLASRVLVGLVLFGLTNPVFILAMPLWLRRIPKRQELPDVVVLLLWQFSGLLVFFLISRPLYLRYFVFLVPPLAALGAWQLGPLVRRFHSARPVWSRLSGPAIVLLIGFAVMTTSPRIPELLSRQESDTLALASYIASMTDESDVVLTEYPGINFIANRPSIREASIIAGDRTESGMISGQLIITQIEAQRIKLVLVHVAGGEPSPHHFANLADLDLLESHLDAHFDLLPVYNRAGQLINIYQRKGVLESE
jgi:hypothetical protein